MQFIYYIASLIKKLETWKKRYLKQSKKLKIYQLDKTVSKPKLQNMYTYSWINK